MNDDRPAPPVPTPATPSPGITVVVDPRAKGNARAESQQGSSHDIGGTRLREDYLGVVLRNIDNLRIGRLNHHHLRGALILYLNRLLLIALECPHRISLLTEALNRIHNHPLICGERLPNGRKVVDVLRHHVEDLRKIHQRNESRIKALCLGRVGARLAAQAPILVQPAINVEDLLRIGRCCADLRQQRVGVEGDRRQQLVQLIGSGHRSLRMRLTGSEVKAPQPHETDERPGDHFLYHELHLKR